MIMKMKVNILVVIKVILLLFVAYNIVWYFFSYKKYSKYEQNFKEIADSGVKIHVDDEEYQYSVKKPGYLMWDGNLAITDNNLENSVIIWLDSFGADITSGVMIMDENNEVMQIEMKDKTTALDKRNQKIVDSYNDEISKLYDKARDIWKLEM